MAAAFPVSGNIDPTSFPHLLVDLHRHGATGSLKVNGPVHPKALYFRSGRILFGSSNDPRDQLGAILIEGGRITREQLDDVNAKVGPGNPLAKVLAESGFVNQRELGDAARVKVERILADVLSWESGSFEFEDGVLPKGAVDLKLSTERLLLAAVQRITERSFALRHLQGLSAVLEPAPDGEPALSEIRAEVWPLLERLDGQRTLKDAIALTRLDEFEAAKTACAMLFLGIVRHRAAGEEVLDLAQEARIGFEAPARAATPARDDEMLTIPVEPISLGRGPSFPIPQEGIPGAAAEPADFSPEPTAAPPLAPPQPPPIPPAADEAPHGFAFADAEPEPAPGPEIDLAATAILPKVESVPSFTVDAPRPRVGIDTEPGDRPVYKPAAPPEPPAPTVPTVSISPPPPSRPTQEDLAALDALLSPSASGQVSRPVERPRPERWEPQTRPPSATPARRPAPRPTTGTSKAPIVAAFLAAVAVAAFAGWYFLLRPVPPKAARVPAPVTRPTAVVTAPETLSAPATLASSPAAFAPSPGAASTAPTPAPVATPLPTVPTPSATPRSTPPPRPTPATAVAAPPAGPATSAATGGKTADAADPRALLRQGSLPDAARAFASTLAGGARGRFSVQLLVACSPETVQKALATVGTEELFILPVSFQGRACYRMCWGLYDSRQSGDAALSRLPPYFRQGGANPRLHPLAELLP